MRNLRKRQGFTLIELLVAVLIIGIISAWVYPKFGPVKEKTYRTTMLNSLSKMVHAQENYMDAHDTYGTIQDLEDEMGWVPDEDVTITFSGAPSAYGFIAVASHLKTDAQCGIQYGSSGASGTEYDNKAVCVDSGDPFTP